PLLHMVDQDLVQIRCRLISIPDTLGIDHHCRPQLAAVQTSGGIDAHILDALFLRAGFEIIAKLLRALLLAAAAGMTRGTFVGAAKSGGPVVWLGTFPVRSACGHFFS